MKDIEEKIMNYLREMTGNYILNGAEYLSKAVIYYPYCNFKMMDVYQIVSKDLNKSKKQIERGIRYFIHHNEYFIDNLLPLNNKNAVGYLFTIFKKEIYEYWIEKE